jgi:hypothetical protein
MEGQAAAGAEKSVTLSARSWASRAIRAPKPRDAPVMNQVFKALSPLPVRPDRWDSPKSAGLLSPDCAACRDLAAG